MIITAGKFLTKPYVILLNLVRHLLGFLTRRSELSKLRNFDPRCGCEWNSSHDDGGDPNRGIIQGTQAQGHQDPAPESSPPPPPPPSSPTLEPTHDDSQPTKTDDDGDHHPSEDPAEPSPSSFIASNSVSPPPDAPAPPPDVVPPPPPPPPPTNATTTAAPPPQDPSADRTGGGDSPITITGAGGNANGGSVNGGGLINILSSLLIIYSARLIANSFIDNAGDGGKAGSGNAGGDANRAANGNYFSGAGGQAQGGSVNNPGGLINVLSSMSSSNSHSRHLIQVQTTLVMAAELLQRDFLLASSCQEFYAAIRILAQVAKQTEAMCMVLRIQVPCSTSSRVCFRCR